MLGLCYSCLENDIERRASVLIDGVPRCMPCVRGDGAVRPLYAEPVDLLPPVPEPRLRRKSPVLPMHLTPAEMSELCPAASPAERPVVFRIRPDVALPKPSPVVVPKAKPRTIEDAAFRTENPKAPIVQFLMEELAEEMAMRMADYSNHRKSRPHVTLRHMAIWLIRKHTQVSFPAIGRLMGHMHHTSVMHGARCIEKRMQTDRGMATVLEIVWQRASHRRKQQTSVKHFSQTEFAEMQNMVRKAMLASMREVTELLQAGAA